MGRANAYRSLMALLCFVFAGLLAPQAFAWEYWGGDPGGMRFSTIDQIAPGNVGQLVRAWEFHTGDLMRRDAELMGRTKFEATPLFVENSLILCTPFNEVIALDPGTGTQKWRFDPKLSTTLRPGNRYDCRGVAYWVDHQAPVEPACHSRIFTGTTDLRIIALDARTGTPCSDFGVGGEVKLDVGTPLAWPGEMQITSPPVVARDLVIVGSSIADNVRVEAPRGTVRAFDARTGALRWTWDPLTHEGIDAGAANVWPPMSVDEERGLVFLPTTSASPDFWGGRRPGNNEHADSVAALRAETGELVWAFQTVHHDLWDYDLPAQPTLARVDTGAGQRRDVVIQATKQGFLFVLDEATGQPIWPVEERPVPQGRAEGERLSPTQPFPTHVPTLVPQRISADDAFGLISRAACHDKLARARNEGLYTPPSTQGTVVFPFTGGGVNWGGVAFDPVNQNSLCQHVASGPHRHPDPRDRGPCLQTCAWRGIRTAARRCLRHDARGGAVAGRRVVQSSALGRSGRRRSQSRQDPVAGHRRYHRRRSSSELALSVGHATRQRCVDHRRGPRIHRR